MPNYKRPTTRDELPASLPFTDDISVLATPISLGARTAPNRILYQPMEGCDGTFDGAPDELTIRRYLRFAKGGAGIIWFEATAVVPEGRANPRQMYLNEKNADAFARLIEDTKKTCLAENGYEPIIVCQLTHSGRYSKPNGKPEPMISYNKPVYEGNNPLPSSCIVSDDYLDSLTERYVNSAKLCEAVGFDGADIKACHGYLLSELLNSYLREGRYGGSYENRTRLFMDAVSAVKSACSSDFIISSRFNAYDGYDYPYGIGDSGTVGVPDFTEAKRIASDLAARGATLLNVTMGNPYTNNEVNRPTINATYAAPFDSIKRMIDGAKAVHEAAPNAAVCVSGISYLGDFAPNVTAAGINNGDYQLAGFGRQIFSYPDLARDIVKNGRMEAKNLCLTCGKCTEVMRAGKTPGCVIYDKDIYLKLYKKIGK